MNGLLGPNTIMVVYMDCLGNIPQSPVPSFQDLQATMVHLEALHVPPVAHYLASICFCAGHVRWLNKHSKNEHTLEALSGLHETPSTPAKLSYSTSLKPSVHIAWVYNFES